MTDPDQAAEPPPSVEELLTAVLLQLTLLNNRVEQALALATRKVPFFRIGA